MLVKLKINPNNSEEIQINIFNKKEPTSRQIQVLCPGNYRRRYCNGGLLKTPYQ